MIWWKKRAVGNFCSLSVADSLRFVSYLTLQRKNFLEGDMPTIKLTIDSETYRRLSDSAVRDLRPIPWQAIALLRAALGVTCPYSKELDERKRISAEPAQ
jgi:hypothetical protein